MAHRFRLAALVAAGLGLTLFSTGSAASAAGMTRTLQLHGGMYTRKAMATARVTQVSADDYRIQITAQGLPAPTMLHVKPQRHVYLAWVIDGIDKHAMMGMLHLTPDKAGHTYRANGVVLLKHVTRIMVTADKSAMQHMPTMPEVTVLDTGGHGM